MLPMEGRSECLYLRLGSGGYPVPERLGVTVYDYFDLEELVSILTGRHSFTRGNCAGVSGDL